jgi:predicted Zn-dependent peptidase
MVYTSVNGLTVWLLERHTLPVVSMTLTVPTGASSDPKGKGGLALATAGMLDEGAGKRGALELARDIDTLGAKLATYADADASYATITVLKRNLAPAFAIFGDVVARPRFEPVEWRRVHDLWQNDLKSRASDADATARVVARVVLWGPEHPYGHPWDGTTASAKSVDLPDVKSFYARAWRPDQATLVVAGDVKREELAPLLEQAFGTWKNPTGRPTPPLVPPAPKGPWPRLVVVDRPEAPQSVIACVRPGIAANDPDAPVLTRVNTAIGGSFTSRLNQDLREEHGWSYGARTRFSFSRGPGQVIAYAAVFTDKTGDALKAMLGELEEFAKKGMTEEEVEKTRSQARADLVRAYESVEGISGKLAGNASLGLGVDYEAVASVRRDTAGKGELNRLAAAYYDPKEAVILVVGPRAQVDPQLKALGLPAPEYRDAHGNVVK